MNVLPRPGAQITGRPAWTSARRRWSAAQRRRRSCGCGGKAGAAAQHPRRERLLEGWLPRQGGNGRVGRGTRAWPETHADFRQLPSSRALAVWFQEPVLRSSGRHSRLPDPPAGQPGGRTWPIGAARQEDSLLELQYLHNPMKGALALPLGPCGDLRRHGAQHRHRPRWLPAPQLHRGLPDRARAQDAPRGVTPSGDLPRFQGAQRHDDGCVHPPDSLSAGDALWHRSLRA